MPYLSGILSPSYSADTHPSLLLLSAQPNIPCAPGVSVSNSEIPALSLSFSLVSANSQVWRSQAPSVPCTCPLSHGNSTGLFWRITLFTWNPCGLGWTPLHSQLQGHNTKLSQSYPSPTNPVKPTTYWGWEEKSLLTRKIWTCICQRPPQRKKLPDIEAYKREQGQKDTDGWPLSPWIQPRLKSIPGLSSYLNQNCLFLPKPVLS